MIEIETSGGLLRAQPSIYNNYSIVHYCLDLMLQVNTARPHPTTPNNPFSMENIYNQFYIGSVGKTTTPHIKTMESFLYSLCNIIWEVSAITQMESMFKTGISNSKTIDYINV